MEPTNRAAQTYYKSFNKAAEKIAEIDPVAKSAAYKSQLSQLEINLKNLKKIEPGYDTSALDALYEKYKNTIGSQDQQNALGKDKAKLDADFAAMWKPLQETKLNTDNIEMTVTRSTEFQEKQLQLFRNKFPDQDTSGYEQQIRDFQQQFRAKLEQYAAGNTAALNVRDNLEKAFLPGIQIGFFEILDPKERELCKDILNQGQHIDLITIVSNEQREEKMQPFIDAYKERTERFIGTNDVAAINARYIPEDQLPAYIKQYGRLSLEQSEVSQFVKDMLKKAKEFQDGVDDYKNGFDKKIRDYDPLHYANLQLKYFFLKGMKVVFPAAPFFASVCSQYEDLISLYGSIENYRNKIRQNKLSFAKTVKMPAAVTSNAEVESMVRTAFESTGWEEEVLKIHLLSHDWKTERNSELIIVRTYDAAIAARQKDGTCMLYTMTIVQDDLGDRFSVPRRLSHNAVVIAEENI